MYIKHGIDLKMIYFDEWLYVVNDHPVEREKTFGQALVLRV